MEGIAPRGLCTIFSLLYSVVYSVGAPTKATQLVVTFLELLLTQIGKGMSVFISEEQTYSFKRRLGVYGNVTLSFVYSSVGG